MSSQNDTPIFNYNLNNARNELLDLLDGLVNLSSESNNSQNQTQNQTQNQNLAACARLA